MVIWAAAATALCIALIVLFMAYRRQIKDICRHLAFRKKNKTNLRMHSGLPFKELDELADNVNYVLDESEQLKREAHKKEKNLKTAITNVSHDIRTPLTSLDGYFQLLGRADSEEEREQYIKIIRKRIDSLKGMLEELFTYTKLQNDAYSFSMEILDLKKCVCDTLFAFYHDFKEKGLEPSIRICEEEVRVRGNEEAFWRILQNLIKNILEHGCGQVRMSLSVADGRAVFLCENRVDDAEEIDTEKVFQQFYKADLARSRSSTGLGLAIAKGLAEHMDGSLSAELEGDWFRLKAEFPVLGK